VPIGQWVIEKACVRARRWLDQGVAPTRFQISVNLSGLQLQHPHLTEDVQRALESAGLSARQLVLEVTESAAMGDVQVSLKALHRQTRRTGRTSGYRRFRDRLFLVEPSETLSNRYCQDRPVIRQWSWRRRPG
jgi:EAL domain-containing protein (putative c-di-GMP-specific phosphodiesterase class I)